MTESRSALGKVAFGLAGAAGIYALIIGALMTPGLQRFALYANKINTLFWDDLNQPQTFGFAKNQVTPFNILTPDGETLYAWHVLPIDLYTRNEQALQSEKRSDRPASDFTQTTGFRLLTANDPSPARVVINFHGNAGHIAQGWRTDTYRTIVAQPNTHVITIDYRGFGHSTGSPTEAGLITDGTTLVDYVMHNLGIPADRIVLLGQSLGTAVSSAVALHLASPDHELIPASTRALRPVQGKATAHKPTTLAGVILVAPFSSIPSLMLTYRMGGLVPILFPLRPFPNLGSWLTGQMLDHWPSAKRLAAYYETTSANKSLLSHKGRAMGSLEVFHATNDKDISYHQTEIICAAVLPLDIQRCTQTIEGAGVLNMAETGKPRVRFEILEHGGHNRIITYSPISVALARVFSGVQ